MWFLGDGSVPLVPLFFLLTLSSLRYVENWEVLRDPWDNWSRVVCGGSVGVPEIERPTSGGKDHEEEQEGQGADDGGELRVEICQPEYQTQEYRVHVRSSSSPCTNPTLSLLLLLPEKKRD